MKAMVCLRPGCEEYQPPWPDDHQVANNGLGTQRSLWAASNQPSTSPLSCHMFPPAQVRFQPYGTDKRVDRQEVLVASSPACAGHGLGFNKLRVVGASVEGGMCCSHSLLHEQPLGPAGNPCRLHIDRGIVY